MICTVVSQLRHLLNVHLLLLTTFQFKVVQKNYGYFFIVHNVQGVKL